jgi:hypothetical protein
VSTALRVCWENKRATDASLRKSEDDSAVPLATSAPKSHSSVSVSVESRMKFMKISRDIRGVVTAFDARIASVHNSSS